MKNRVYLVLCGSFSPPTILHLRLLEMAKDEAKRRGLEVLGGLISPVSDGYGKTFLAPSIHRLELCKRAIQRNSWISVDDWEISQPTHTPTAKVLASIEERLGDGVGVMLVCGSDLVCGFTKPGLWADEDIAALLTRHGIIAIERNPFSLCDAILRHPILYKHQDGLIVVKQHIPNEVSSTKVRLLIRRKLSLKYLIPDACIDYIEKHDLFRDEEN